MHSTAVHAAHTAARDTLPEVDIMAALERVAPMHSMMPVMLPVADPSHTATMTPRVSTIRAVSSSRVGVAFSMNTARMAVHTGIADLQAGLSSCSDSIAGMMSHCVGKTRPAGRACKLQWLWFRAAIQASGAGLAIRDGHFAGRATWVHHAMHPGKSGCRDRELPLAGLAGRGQQLQWPWSGAALQT